MQSSSCPRGPFCGKLLHGWPTRANCSLTRLGGWGAAGRGSGHRASRSPHPVTFPTLARAKRITKKARQGVSMSSDPNKKSPRTFQCRDVLWDTFEQMARELECSVDYLINESMKQYSRQRNYGERAPMREPPSRDPGYASAPPPPPMPARGTIPPTPAGRLPPAAHASRWWRGHASSSSSPPDAQPEPAAPSSRRWVGWRIADASSPAWAAASCVPAEPASSGRARAPAASPRDP